MSAVPVLDCTTKIEELVKNIQEDLEDSLNRSDERLQEIQKLLIQCTDVHTIGTLWVELVADACSCLREALSKAFHNNEVNTTMNSTAATPEMQTPVSEKRQRDTVALSEPPMKKQCVTQTQLERTNTLLESTQGGPPDTITGPPLTRKEQANNWMVEGENLQYSMCKDSKMTVRDLWNEYQLGSRESVKPVKWLDWYYGPCWRAEETSRQYYHRRQVIYREVEQMVQHRLRRELAEGKIQQQDLLEGSIVRREMEATAVEWLDQWPRGPYSVHQMGQQIKRARKANPNGNLPAFETKKGWENQPQAPSPWYAEKTQSLATKSEDSPALSQGSMHVQVIQSPSSLIEDQSHPTTPTCSRSTTASVQDMVHLPEICVPSGFPESNIREFGITQTKNKMGIGRPWEL